ncbi:hypothetical protein [Azospirillum sp. ST 5-10]|uniref:hypothetical protein n=1 Tax=unclassified Azospirillum TaxID=2630922 RepID=UPI003F49CB99
MDPYVARLEGRLNAIEFLLEQILAQQCLTASDPVQNAVAAGERAAVLMSRSRPGPEMDQAEFEQLAEATTAAMDRLMRLVLQRVQEVTNG